MHLTGIHSVKSVDELIWRVGEIKGCAGSPFHCLGSLNQSWLAVILRLDNADSNTGVYMPSLLAEQCKYQSRTHDIPADR